MTLSWGTKSPFFFFFVTGYPYVHVGVNILDGGLDFFYGNISNRGLAFPLATYLVVLCCDYHFEAWAKERGESIKNQEKDVVDLGMIDVVIIEDLENYIYGYGSWVFNILCGISFGCCCEVFVASYTSYMLCGVLPFDNIYVYLSKKRR